MDINKVKESQQLHYSKKDLQLLYWQAKAKDIKKKELKDIKKALYEIVDLGQYSQDFKKLIKILKLLPEKALKSIEHGEFTNIYNKIATYNHNEYGAFYKGTFHHCNNLLLLLYTDYSNINSKQEFDLVSSSFYLSHYIEGNEEINNLIFNINPSLSYLLENYKRYKILGPKYTFNLSFDTFKNNLDKLFNNLQVTLLMHINTLNHQYQLPCEIALYLFENIKITHNTILKSYTKCEDKYLFCKILLIEYLVLKNNHNLKPEELNQKTKKLLKDALF